MKDHIALKKHFSDLLDFYGRLLTEAQRQIMADYYLYDLSLSEISENRAITRSGASDTIRKAAKKLEGFEDKLGLIKAFQNAKQNSSPRHVAIIEELEGKIKNGL